MQKTEIFCDNCNKNITLSEGGLTDYIIVVDNGYRINNLEIFSGILKPPVDHKSHFCDIQCLYEWIMKRPVDKKGNRV